MCSPLCLLAHLAPYKPSFPAILSLVFSVFTSGVLDLGVCLCPSEFVCRWLQTDTWFWSRLFHLGVCLCLLINYIELIQLCLPVLSEFWVQSVSSVPGTLWCRAPTGQMWDAAMAMSHCAASSRWHNCDFTPSRGKLPRAFSECCRSSRALSVLGEQVLQWCSILSQTVSSLYRTISAQHTNPNQVKEAAHLFPKPKHKCGEVRGHR